MLETLDTARDDDAVDLPPIALALVLADAIWIDPATQKKTILGTFSLLFGTEFPLHLDQMAVYLSLTDARGKIPMALRIVDVDELHEPVKNHEFELDFPDPIAIMEGTFHFSDLVFPSPGEFRLQVLARDELIIERRIVVRPLEEEDDEREDPAI